MIPPPNENKPKTVVGAVLRHAVSIWVAVAVLGAFFLIYDQLKHVPQRTATDSWLTQQAFWKDSSARVGLTEAQSQMYTPFQGAFSGGYTDAVHWFRLTVAASGEPLALVIRPSWLDSVTLYDPDMGAPPVTVGDRHPVPHVALVNLGNALPLPASVAPRQVWLRLQSSSAHAMKLQVMPLGEVSKLRTSEAVWQTVYVGTLIMIFGVLLTLWWSHPEHLLRAYLIRHAIYIVYGVSYLGLPVQWMGGMFPPEFFNQLTSYSILLVVLAAIRFDVIFLNGYQPNRWLLAVFKSLGWVVAGLILLQLAGHTRLALQLNALAVLLGVSLVLLTAFSCKSGSTVEQIMPKKAMVAYYLLVSSSLMIGLLNLLGWVQSSGTTLYGLIIYGLVTGMAMSFILIVRTQRLARQSKQMVWELHSAQQNAHWERRRRDEQSQLLDMLTHELKTPLSVVALAIGTKSRREENIHLASQAVREMKSVIDRCLEANESGELGLTLQRSEVNVFALVQQVGKVVPGLSTRLLVTESKPSPAPVTDIQLLKIIVTNLLHNAARYSAEGTTIDVSVAEHEQTRAGVQIRISNLPGLAGWPDENLIFQKYYRSAGAHIQSGTGLGLYLSRKLARTLGGTLDYQPGQNHIAFALWIPHT
jgi:two-component system, sensor histidine kinase LadS